MDYYQGYEDAMRQGRATRIRGWMGLVVRIIILLLYSAFIYLPLLILSYFLASAMSDLYSNDIFIKSGLTFTIGYFLFALIYFLKGILIRLRNDGRYSWFILWAICIAVTCGVQAVFSQIVLQDFFDDRSITNYQLWSWLSALIIGLLIYSHYQFLTNIAPRSVFWSYQLGFLTIRPLKKPESNPSPQKSSAYFDNAPMKVSYKK
jgi:hypothetical protein